MPVTTRSASLSDGSSTASSGSSSSSKATLADASQPPTRRPRGRSAGRHDCCRYRRASNADKDPRPQPPRIAHERRVRCCKCHRRGHCANCQPCDTATTKPKPKPGPWLSKYFRVLVGLLVLLFVISSITVSPFGKEAVAEVLILGAMTVTVFVFWCMCLYVSCVGCMMCLELFLWMAVISGLLFLLAVLLD